MIDKRKGFKSIIESATNHQKIVQDTCNTFIPKLEEILGYKVQANIFTALKNEDGIDHNDVFVFLELWTDGEDEETSELNLNFEINDKSNIDDIKLLVRTNEKYFPLPMIQKISQVVEEAVFSNYKGILN